MDFDVTQVTGLTNDDEVSKEYRWLKQNIERLNRTFKFSYRVTNGYGSNEGASTHLALLSLTTISYVLILTTTGDL